MKKPPLLVDLIKPNYCVSFLKWEGSPYIQATKHSVHTAETMPILESIYNKLIFLKSFCKIGSADWAEQDLQNCRQEDFSKKISLQ